MHTKKFRKKLLSTFVALVFITSGLLPLGMVGLTAKAETTGSWGDYTSSSFAGGTGSPANPYQIATAGQLAFLAQEVNIGAVDTLTWDYYRTESYILTSDIDLSAHFWVPIGDDGYFTGTFDGAKNTITGLTIGTSDTPDSTYQEAGLFGETDVGATIKDVNLTGFAIYSSATIFLGGLAGISNGTVSNVSATGTVADVESYADVSGLVGDNLGTVSGSCAAVTVIGGDSAYVGGLVGVNNLTISSSYATGTVTGGDGAQVGGLVGWNFNNGGITDSYATGAVSGGDGAYVGGLVGYNNGTGVITDVYWNTDSAQKINNAGVTNKLGIGYGTGIATGLTTSQMQGSAADTNMSDLMAATDDNGNVWADTTGYYPHLKALEATLNFNSNEGSPVPSITFNPGAVLAAPTTTRACYSLNGWRTDGGQAFDFSQPVMQGQTLTAEWVPNIYSVSYNLDGGSVGTANPTGYTIESGTITLNNPTKTGYTFAGWSGTGISGTAMTVNIPAGSTGDRSYTANWTVNAYDITYNLNGGTNSGSNPAAYTYGSGITLSVPTRAGYTFDGWFSDSAFQTRFTSISDTQMGNVTLYADWTVNAYDITYNLSGGTNSGSNPASYTYGSGFTLSAPARADYAFGGWFSDSAFTAKVTSISDTQTGDVTLYADWITESVTGGNVTIDLSNATLPSGVTSVTASVTAEPTTNSTTESIGNVIVQNPSLGATNNFVLYDLKLLGQNGDAITITGSVTVRLPIPQGMTNPHVFWYDGTTLHDMNATVQDGELVFTTTHFSYYAVAQASTASGSIPNPKTGDNSRPILPVETVGALAAFAAGTGILEKKRLHRADD